MNYGLWLISGFWLLTASLTAQVWNPNLDNEHYQNPILHSDYSDPDVIRHGDDFYMTASSFNCVPALPILHSKDMVNWRLINYAVQDELPPVDFFNQPQHGNGVWAPAIRYHDGWFYIFYGDPDFGIYMVKTRDPAGKWEKPHLVKAAKGWIDPCPFWDEDGRAYLVHAFAGSRAGNKSIVVLHQMTSDGSQLLDDGVLVFDGHQDHPTIEGTKMYKRNGYYYIFAPGGGVAEGWQTILRSKQIYGPYEDKIVLHQGNTSVNGPHQGAWVSLENGEEWFFHFQEKQPYGRIVHLQPAKWQNDWLLIGEDVNQDGIGEPVSQYRKPGVNYSQPLELQTASDEFNTRQLHPNWQWHANPQPLWSFPTELGFLRLNPVIKQADARNLWDHPNLLLQKMPAEEFTVTTKLDFFHHFDGEQTGLLVMGRDYAHLSLVQENGQLLLKQVTCYGAQYGKPEKIVASVPFPEREIYLQVSVTKGGMCQFAYSKDGQTYTNIGEVFTAKEGKWIGAKVGIYCLRNEHENDGGYANYDYFRIEK